MHRTGGLLQYSPVPSITGIAEPYYSNEDIAILHQIVILAQDLLPKLPDRERLPTNALFSAYYDVLPRLGVNSDHDSRYARVLFKIGGSRSNGSLYDRFEEVLSKMGIEIEFDQAETEKKSQDELSHETTDDIFQGTKKTEEPQTRERRSSETSFDNRHRQKAEAEEHRRSSSITSWREIATTPVAQLRIPEPRLTSEYIPPSVPKGATGTKDQRARSVKAWMKNQPDTQIRKRACSISSDDELRIRRRSFQHIKEQRLPNRLVYLDGYQTGSASTAVAPPSEHDYFIDNNPVSYTPSMASTFDDCLQDKASHFLRQTLASFVRQKIQSWRQMAISRRPERLKLDLIASTYDRYVLIHQALQLWHTYLVVKHRTLEMESLFAHLENRSTMARDIYLVHKAFTHWINRADECAQGTLLARRHIVRTRIFHAWQQTTAVNELKVKRHITNGHFMSWRKRFVSIVTSQRLISLNHKAALTGRFYNTWVRRLKEARALALWRERTQHRTLSYWIAVSRSMKATCERTTRLRQWGQLRNMLISWKIRVGVRVLQDQDAHVFRKSCLCTDTLKWWRCEARIVPLEKLLMAHVSARQIRGTFATWKHQTQQKSRAAASDRSRILREALIRWRHRLRAVVLHGRIENRIAMEIIYAWALKERSVAEGRMVSNKLLNSCLQVWLHKLRNLEQTQISRDSVVQSFTVRKRLAKIIHHWEVILKQRGQFEATALSLRDPKLVNRTLSLWSEKLRTFRMLRIWAVDAEFYFFTSKFLRQWDEALGTAKRRKRKASYIEVRRLRKHNSAKIMLLVWQRKAHKALGLDDLAFSISRKKSVELGTKMLDQWRNRSGKVNGLRAVGRGWALRKQLASWKTRSASFQLVDFEIRIDCEERLLSRQVKRWSLKTLQMRNHNQNAVRLHDKKSRKACRKMFVYWRRKTSIARPVEHMKLSEQPVFWNVLGDSGNISSRFQNESRVSKWSHSLDGNATAFAPGYLSTPSKTGRVMVAAGRLFSTTPKAVLSTPFETQLRAQYPHRYVMKSRQAGKGSQVGMTSGFAGFADLVESEHDYGD